ncbi:MAG: hypothetical protein AAB669_00985 [Patescibacteria group bacterium]
MRSKVLVVLVVVVSILAAYTLSKPITTQTRQGTIELTHLPDQYCPLSAAVVATDLDAKTPKILLDIEVAIDECRYITLAKLSGLGSEPQFIFVKISGQLAFRVQIDSIKGRYQFAPSLGDVNNDNIIDSNDETQVSSALFSNDETKISLNDLDRDKKVSVLDLSLTRINRRAGVERPDGQSWSRS